MNKNPLIMDLNGQPSVYPFPRNLAEGMPAEMRAKIMRYIIMKYAWPQIMDRQQYEQQWEKLFQMARALYKIQYSKERSPLRRSEMARNIKNTEGKTASEAPVFCDSIVFEVVNRLTQFLHATAFSNENMPVKYEIRPYSLEQAQGPHYSPRNDMYEAMNCYLNYNLNQHDVYVQGQMVARHHFTYGVSYVNSEFCYQVTMQPIFENGVVTEVPMLTKVGTTFEPISIRKLWLNHRVPSIDMNKQICPFFYDLVPRFNVQANPYDSQTNPFGFTNLETLPVAQRAFSTQELQSLQKVFEESQGKDIKINMNDLLDPDKSVEMLWTFYPMLPVLIDENNQVIDIDEDGSKNYPGQRFIVQMFGGSLFSSSQELVRMQQNFYPNNSIPLYASVHIPTVDDGAYPMSIGTILESHYEQLCIAIQQFTDNKDWINNPPAMVSMSSPAMEHQINKAGAKIPVLSQNDVKVREPYDATGTTPAFISGIREQMNSAAMTTDSILGQAMGGRTSATEAENAFSMSTSVIAVGIDSFVYMIYGGYAKRVQWYARWLDVDILRAISGRYGQAITPQSLALDLGLSCNRGSEFVSSLRRQGHIRYILESTQPGDPAINRAALMRMLLTEWKFPNVSAIINDGGEALQVQTATTQAIETYLGLPVMVDPSQDHSIAVSVKTSFIKDRDSEWNTNPAYVVNSNKLIEQIQIHQQFIQIQALQQQLQMMAQSATDPALTDDALQQLQKAQAQLNPAGNA